ncbi:MAG: hypothetical protein D6762_04375 [Candidatus Neomarinimicrobiota bacterium]|nr:MAG: hypothetical protein D6762_04375 [Candidatus Neomarinimicrobiota bacterium]
MSRTQERGTVRVEQGRYRVQGAFHYVYPNSPIFDEEGKLVGVTNPRDITHIHTYGGEAPFFEALSQGRLLGTECRNPDCEHTGTRHVPFIIHCPDCLQRTDIIDVTDLARQTAKVHTFMVTERTGAFNTLKKPVRFINVEFEGVATILMSYLSVGEPKIGQRVVPIFNTHEPTYTILDLSWVPEGTSVEQLPDHFTFGA